VAITLLGCQLPTKRSAMAAHSRSTQRKKRKKMKPILKISTELNNLLPKANEVWIACATISKYGLNLIQDRLRANAKLKILVGIDLPTSPEVLYELKKLNNSEEIEAKLFFNKEKFYHPKLYIIKSDSEISAIVGSGNCTMGGLENNLEISIRIDDSETCEKLIKKGTWFGRDCMIYMN